MEYLLDLVFDYNVRNIALGSAVLGIISGALGCFAVLRRQALLGESVSHAALPGIVLAFMVFGTRASLVLLLGAALAGWLAMLSLIAIVRLTRIKDDAAFALLMSVFFGGGLVLLTIVQKSTMAGQSGLDSYLFGQAAALMTDDVLTMGGMGLLILTMLLLFWKEFKLLSFDRAFGASQGFPMLTLDVLLTALLVLSTVIGLKAVGVVLMSAMLVAPAAAARQWTNHLGLMVALAGLFGALAGVSGALISTLARGLATGPAIIVCISLLVICSLLVAPNRGLVWEWLQTHRNRQRLRAELRTLQEPEV
ncbi:MAG: metal ABC transporter permease [Chloroflexaceae bacterium]